MTATLQQEPAPVTAESKRLAGWQARAALAGGFQIVEFPDGWMVSRWDRLDYLSTPADVERFLTRIGAPK
jgi:hypothetical protein